jgi:hypothetical protein
MSHLSPQCCTKADVRNANGFVISRERARSEEPGETGTFALSHR